MLASPSSSNLQTTSPPAVVPQSSRWLWYPLETNLTLGNQILLRVLLCTLSFTVGIGYSDRNPEPVVESAIAAPLLPGQLVAQLPTEPLPQAPPPPTVRIKAVGDMVLGTNYPGNRLPTPPETLFRAVIPLLQGADLVFGNFESTLTNATVPSKDTSRPNVFAFRTPPSYSQFLRAAGFQVLNIANNHALDFGRQGFGDTAAAIEQQGMQVVGRKDDIVYSTLEDGLTVAWVGFTYGTQLNSIQALGSAQSLVSTAQANADMVVVSFHGGAEGTSAMRTRNQTEYFFGENRGNVVAFSRALINTGADLVLG
ncbi:MAG: CapA family protein, partial [Spirulina sp. SIO3F2]|nr:CapA family protein [Spirulina sp. SIO3F2]